MPSFGGATVGGASAVGKFGRAALQSGNAAAGAESVTADRAPEAAAGDAGKGLFELTKSRARASWISRLR